MKVADQTIQNLEYDKLLKWLSSYAQSGAGKRKILKLKPLASIDAISRKNEMVSQLIELITAKGKLALSGLRNSAGLLKKARAEGAYLTAPELVKILHQCRLYVEIKRSVQQHKAYVPSLHNLLQDMYEPHELIKSISTTISDLGEILDTASDKLFRTKKEIKELGVQITGILESFINNKNNAPLIQEPLILDRDGRYVILAKGEKRKELDGIIHGSSGSGAAYYCELFITVEQNNKLKVLKEKEKNIYREILQKHTDSIRKLSKELIDNQRKIALIDSMHALAVYAVERNAHIAVINASSPLELKSVYHPLLMMKASKTKRTDIVPLIIGLVSPVRGMIITGPNMGGKTVALKNIGLSVLMAHSGIPVIGDFASVPFFDALFADIGEKQDLMQNLSTFSSHMKNIITMIEYDEGNALFIIDELGTGTDPSEGAPLAVSILEHLLHKKGTVIATTHHNAVKICAESNPNLINASMDFDVDTLKPTFKIIPGIAGTSHAFDIASKLGIPVEIVARAKNIRDKKDEAYYLIVDKLNAQLKEMELQQQKWFKERNQLENELIKSKNDHIDQKKQLIQEQVLLKEQVDNFLHQLRKQWETLHADLKKESLEKATQKTRSYLKSVEKEAIKIVQTPSVSLEDLDEAFKPGDYVVLQGTKSKGRVIEISEKDNNAMIDFGNYTIQLPLGVLKKSEPPGKEEKQNIIYPTTEKKGSRPESKQEKEIRTSLNLIGLTVDEAMGELQKFIDRAVLYNTEEIKIIHGYGKLKAAVLNYLKGSAFVKSSRDAETNEGGSAASIIRIIGL